MNLKKELLALIFYFIPGSRHIYLGYLNRGAAFATIFLTNIFVPLILYKLFHIYGFLILFIFLPLIWLISKIDIEILSYQNLIHLSCHHGICHNISCSKQKSDFFSPVISNVISDKTI